MHLIKRFIIMMMFITVAVAAADARARCIMYQEGSPERAEANRRIYGDAFYIGVVEVLEIDLINDPEISVNGYNSNLYDVTVRAAVPYKGDFKEPITVRGVNAPENPDSGKVGGMYERIIYKTDNGYQMSGQCSLMPSAKLDYMRQTAKQNEQYKSFDKNCQTEGKVAYLNNYELVCATPAKDSSEACKDNSDCEGVCQTELSYLAIKQITDKYPDHKFAGLCARFVDIDDNDFNIINEQPDLDIFGFKDRK